MKARLLAVLCLAGCVAEPSAAFAEIRCLESNELCVGRPVGAADAWVYVISDADLGQLVDTGAQPLAAWSDGCAAGQVPATFMPEHRCLWLPSKAVSVCYAGDGSWWTQVERCVTAPESPAWSDLQCDGMAGEIGAHPWDNVTCADVESGACLGLSGEDFMLVGPTCWFDSWPTLSP